jgi:hypothetical protein
LATKAFQYVTEPRRVQCAGLNPASPYAGGVANDARSIAEVLVESWKTTYKGIFPDTLLESLSIDNRERSWKQALVQPGLVTLVGCDAVDQSWDSSVVGARERVS